MKNPNGPSIEEKDDWNDELRDQAAADKVRQLEESNQRMREALRRVSRIDMILGSKDSRYPTCPACKARSTSSTPIVHRPECYIDAALTSSPSSTELMARVERCIECGGFVSEWVEAEHRNGRICRPCESLIAIRADLAAARAEVEKLEQQVAAYDTDAKVRINLIERLRAELARMKGGGK